MPDAPRKFQPHRRVVSRTVGERKTAYQRGYGRRWQRARLGYLASHPLCAECERHGKVKAASVVDHIRPHKGDMVLFWDRDNWQSLCFHCHAVKTGKGL